MKLIHLSDLHLGKRLDEENLLEDQSDILDKILGIVAAEQPDAVLIAGDVYDKTVPSAEAVRLFDDFLSRLAALAPNVLISSGNHDSAERIAFGERLFARANVYLSPVYAGATAPVSLQDAFGTVDLYMLPFLKPAIVRPFFPEAEITTYQDAVRVAVEALQPDPAHRNVLLAHQFVTGAALTGDEERSIGGLDNVDGSVFDAFDYVALGHLHGAQDVGSPRLRYCGSPLKYSFSEAQQEKSVTVVTLGAKGDLSVRTVPLKPLRDLRDVRGTFEELMAGKPGDDYIRATLTDEDDVINALPRLRERVFPHILHVRYDNTRTRTASQVETASDVERKTPLELFEELYVSQNGQPLSAQQRAFMEELIAEVWEENE